MAVDVTATDSIDRPRDEVAAYLRDPANDTRLVADDHVLQADSALLQTCDVFPVSVSLAPGESSEGCVIFEVPTGSSPQRLRFASDSYFGPELGTFILGR